MAAIPGRPTSTVAGRPPAAARSPGARLPPALLQLRRLVSLLDVAIGLGRKVGGFVALLTLGWTYFRLLALGEPLRDMYPGAADPDLRQTLWVVLLLIMAQGWDIPTERLAADWRHFRERFPESPGRRGPVGGATVLSVLWRGPLALAEPVVVRLGRFMDLCVAVANKAGALCALAFLAVLAWRCSVGGTQARSLYPDARDPVASLLADLGVGVVVLGWWAMPFEQIAVFWRRLRGSDEPPAG